MSLYFKHLTTTVAKLKGETALTDDVTGIDLFMPDEPKLREGRTVKVFLCEVPEPGELPDDETPTPAELAQVMEALAKLGLDENN